jgi:hypothetical protein
MGLTTDYRFLASMDVASDGEALFNEVDDGEHVPGLIAVPGVRSAVLGERDIYPGNWRSADDRHEPLRAVRCGSRG